MDVQSLLDEANVYFAQLNDEEKYGWIAMVVGFLLIVAGLVLLVV